MLLSLAIIFLAGFSAAAIAERIGLPRIIGMIAVGIVISPYVLDLLDPTILGISSELRQIALIIILIRAGLSLDLSDLKKVGRPAAMMSFLPAAFGMTVSSCGSTAVMGAVLSAVSPAVVVPRMVKLIDGKYGTEKGIPQMILAGASCDDVFVIVLFSSFVTMAQGGIAKPSDLVDIPVSIVLGTILGAAAGLALHLIFATSFRRGKKIRSTVKVIIILGTAFLLISAEKAVKPYAALSGLLAVMTMACVLKRRSAVEVTAHLSGKFSQLWIGAEVMLFVLVGAAVDIRSIVSASAYVLLMIFVALIFRSVGVFICMLGTDLNAGERLFCIIAYLPKATVQAAIGSVPLSMGLPCGKIVLSAAVLGIVITAPLGAIGIDRSFGRLLSKETEKDTPSGQ